MGNGVILSSSVSHDVFGAEVMHSNINLLYVYIHIIIRLQIEVFPGTLNIKKSCTTLRDMKV